MSLSKPSHTPGSRPERPLRIAIAGAGAIGCAVATQLAQAGHDISLLARGQTLAAVRRNGLELQRRNDTLRARVAVSDKAAQLGPQEAVLICTKAHDLHAIAPSIQALIGPDTVIVPMVNGVPWWYFHKLEGRYANRTIRAVDPDGALPSLLPTRQIVGAIQFLTAERLAPGVVASNNPMLVILGELDNTESPRAARLVQAFQSADIEARLSPRIRDSLWVKILANLTSNPLSVVSGATLDVLYTDPRLASIARRILNEGLMLAAAYGARIEFDPHTFIEQAVGMGSVQTSMLQDALAGRPLELAAIGDAVLELAALQEIPMPTVQDILNLAHFRGRQSHSSTAHGP